jgi:hypothetical protein
VAFFTVSSDNIALVASTAKSLIDLGTTSSTTAKVWKWWVEGWDPTTSTNPAWKVEIGLFSAAVTTHTAATPQPWDQASAVSTVTAGVATTTEGAGTATNVEVHRVQTSGGLIIFEAPQPRIIPPASFWRIRLTPAAVTAGVTVGVLFEE